MATRAHGAVRTLDFGNGSVTFFSVQYNSYGILRYFDFSLRFHILRPWEAVGIGCRILYEILYIAR